MSLLNDAKALVRVRRKVERATDVAMDAKRQFKRCYPDSVGPTVEVNERPHAVAINTTDARWWAEHKQEEVIDRTPAALRKLHEPKWKPADILKSMDMASNRVGQRVGSLNA